MKCLSKINKPNKHFPESREVKHANFLYLWLPLLNIKKIHIFLFF